jgi:hypothetical protein
MGSTRRFAAGVVCAALVAGLCGCSEARLVSCAPAGGVVGTTEHVHTDTDRKGDPLLAGLRIAPVTETSQQTTTVEEKKEWRIYFHGTDAAAVSAAPPP